MIVFTKSSGKQTSDLSLEVRVTKFQSDLRFALDGVKLKFLCLVVSAVFSSSEIY